MSTLSPAWVGFGDLSFIVVINVIAGSLDYNDAGDVTWYLWPASGIQQQVSIYIHLEESEKTVALNVTVYDNQSRAIPTTQSRYQTSASSWVHEVTFLATLPITSISDQTVIGNMASGYEQYITGQLLLPTVGPSVPTDVSDVQLPAAPPEPVVVVNEPVPQQPIYIPLPRDPYYDVWEPPTVVEEEEAPDPETPSAGFLQGTVLDNFDNPVVCDLVARDRSDNALIGTTTSSAEDGSYSISALTYTEHYVMAFPDEKQAMIHDRVYATPAPIAYVLDNAHQLNSYYSPRVPETLYGYPLYNFYGTYISPDGLNLFFCDTSGDLIGQMLLTTLWDMSTATLIRTLDTTVTDDTPTDIHFNADGTKMFVLGNEHDSVYVWDLSTPWDISTASVAGSLDISGQVTSLNYFSFSTSGHKMYVAEGSTIHEYTMGTPWDLSTCSFTQTGTFANWNHGFCLSADGTKVFVADGVQDELRMYTLSSAWDSTTASLTTTFDPEYFWYPSCPQINSDGSKILMADAGAGLIQIFELDTPYDISTIELHWMDISSYSIDFNEDGSKMFIQTSSTANISEYDLSTPWEITTAVINQSFTPLVAQTWHHFTIENSGNLLFASEYNTGDIKKFALSTPWDLTTIGSELQSETLTSTYANSRLIFNSTGTILILNNNSLDRVEQFVLATPWDLTSASSDGTFSVSEWFNALTSMEMNSDGTRMYCMLDSYYQCIEFILSTPWDITSATYNDTIGITRAINNCKNLVFGKVGNRMYSCNQSTGLVQLNLDQ